MKKLWFLLSVVIFVAIVWGGITYVVGNKAQSYYLDLLDESSQFGFVTFTNTNYERGFLHSKATTLMQIDFPVVESGEEPQSAQDGTSTGEPAVEIIEQTFQLEFEHILYHGPLPVSSGPASRFGSGAAVALIETTLTRFAPDQEGLENLLEEIPELKNTINIARIGFDGTTNSILEIPAFEYLLDEGKVSSGGLKVEGIYSLVSGDMSGSYDMQSVGFNMPEGGSMAWNGLAGEFDLQKVLPMFYVGLSKAVVGGMEMDFPSPKTGELETVKMEAMKMTSNSRFDGEMVHIEQDMAFGGIIFDDEKYGPLLIDAEVKNLDAQALSEFQQQIIAIYKDTHILAPDAIASTILPLYLDLFGKLLAGDPEMKIRKFSLVTPKGDAEGNFNLKCTGIKDVSFDSPVMMMQYIQNIDSSANLVVDEVLIRRIMLERAKSSANEQAVVAKLLEQDFELSDEQIKELAVQQYEQQMEMLLAQNYIVREGDKLKTSITFKQGELIVNGQVLPVFGAN